MHRFAARFAPPHNLGLGKLNMTPEHLKVVFQAVSAFGLAWVLWWITQSYLAFTTLRTLRGPDPISFITGMHIPSRVLYGANVISCEGNLKQWFNRRGDAFQRHVALDYGPVVKMHGMMGVRRIVSAPRDEWQRNFGHLTSAPCSTYRTQGRYTRSWSRMNTSTNPLKQSSSTSHSRVYAYDLPKATLQNRAHAVRTRPTVFRRYVLQNDHVPIARKCSNARQDPPTRNSASSSTLCSQPRTCVGFSPSSTVWLTGCVIIPIHTTVFNSSFARQLRDALQSSVESGKTEHDFLSWAVRVALELIGQGGLGYSFDPLTEDKRDAYADAIKAFK